MALLVKYKCEQTISSI